jgi:outer membrane protein
LTKKYFLYPALALCAATLAHAQSGAGAAVPNTVPNKVGIVHIQNAIISTKDGQKAASALQTKFAPRKAELEKKQSTIAQLQDQLRKGSNTMSEDAKQKLIREIDQNTKSLNRETEDAQAELEQEENKTMQELGQRIIAVLEKYGKENGYAVILDVSSPQTPVMYAANGTDITQDIIALYDKSSPAAAASAPPAAAPPEAAKPAAPPPPKK